ncbi:MAG: Ig-like domain-containing protein, partial [Desulfitobacterium hafniense]
MARQLTAHTGGYRKKQRSMEGRRIMENSGKRHGRQKGRVLISYILVAAMVLFVCGFTASPAFGAIDTKYQIQWAAGFGGPGSDQAFSVVAVPDGFVFTGTLTDEAGLEYTFLIKTDEKGNTLWEKKFGGIFRSSGRAVAQTQDGGYIIAGTSKTYFSSFEKVYLIKTDGEGNLEWEQKLDLEGQGYLNSKRQGFSVKEAAGGYIIAGMILRGDVSDALLIKTNKLGIVSWARLFGGAQWDWFYDVEVTEDGFIAGGFTEKDFKYYEYLVKVDGSGETVWEYTDSVPGGQIKDLIVASDGNIMASGYRHTNVSLIKVSGDGVSYWGKTYENGIGYGLTELKNGDLVIAGNGKILGIRADGTKGWVHDLSGDDTYVNDVVISPSGPMVFAGFRNFGTNPDAYIFELGSDRASLGVSTPNVLKDGSIYLFAPLYLDDGQPDRTATAEVEVKVTQGEGESKTIPLSDGNFFPSDDYEDHDGIYSGIYAAEGEGNVTIELFVDGMKEDSKTVSVINDPELIVLTHLKALYNEFLDTGTAVGADENRNDIPDYFDLLDRMAAYAEAHKGIVVDVNEEIAVEKKWTKDYADFSYDDGDAGDMAKAIDSLMDDIFGNAGAKLKSVAIIGDDEVIPFFRKSDTIFLAGLNAMNEIKYVPNDMQGEFWGNPTLKDTSYPVGYSPPNIMSDVPFGTYVAATPDNDPFPLPRAGVGRIFADKPSTLTAMIDGYEKPINLIPGQSSAAVFNLDSDLIDHTSGVDFPAAVEKAVVSVLRTKFKKEEGWTQADYKKGGYYWHDGTVRDWGGSDVAAGVEKADISFIWSHATHLNENTQKDPDLTYDTFRSLMNAPGHLLINAGCHSGYTVSHNNSMDKSKSFLPYDQAMVKQIIGKQVAYMAPTTYGYSSNYKPTDHDLLAKVFLQALLDGTSGTVGEKWTQAYSAYMTEYNNLYTDYSVYAIYGMCYYGLPTQTVAAAASGFKTLKTAPENDGGPETLRSLSAFGTAEPLALMESGRLNISLNIPEPVQTADGKGRILIEIPGGSGCTMTNFAPILPLIRKTYILPAGSEVESVSLESSPERAVLGPLELQNLHPVNKTFGPVEGSLALSGPYPAEPFTWLQKKREDGVYLTVSAAPVQYDPDSKLVTVWSKMEFDVAYTAPASGTGIREVVVNGGSSVKIGDHDIPVALKIDSAAEGEAALQWQVRDFTGLIIASGTQGLELTAGENALELAFDTEGWTPGDKGLTLLVSKGVVTASWFGDIPVSGLYAGLSMEQRSYDPADPAVVFSAGIRDEGGAPVSGLTLEDFQIRVDGGQVADLTLNEETPGNYRFSFPVMNVTEDIHSLTLSCTVSGDRSAPVSKEFAVRRDVQGPEVVHTDPAQYEAGVALDAVIAVTFDEALFAGVGFDGIQLFKAGKTADTPVETIKAIAGTDLTITPASPLEPNAVYKVVIPAKAVEDVKGNEFTYPYTFRFITYAAPDVTAPAVDSTVPPEGEADFPAEAAVKIGFSESVGAGANAAAISWTADGEPVAFTVTYYANQLILSPKGALPYGAQCEVTVPVGAVNDLWGNSLAEEYTFTFTIEAAADAEAPLILSTVPEDGMTGTLTDALITVHFDEIVLPGDHYDEILLAEGDGEMLSYTAELQRETLTLVPEETFEINREYRVMIPAGAVQDLMGNLLEEACEIRFATGEEADLTAPAAVETVPADGAEGVLADTPVYVYFDEAIQAGDHFGEIDLLDLSGGGEGESIDFTSAVRGRTLTLTPSAGLAYGGEYRVVIPAGAVKDLTGNGSEQDTAFDFWTEAAPDTQPPKLTETSPREGDERVPVYAQILFSFDELLQAGSAFSGISVTGEDGPIPFTKSIDESDLILTPAGAMPLGTVVTVSVPRGALSDLLGNQLNADLTLQFTTDEEAVADTNPPITVHTISGTEGASGWYTSGVEITLTATDDLSGTAGTSWSIGGEIWNDYVKPFTVDREGEVTVYYRSEDREGNVEGVKRFTVKIDTVSPAVSSSLPANGAVGVSKDQPVRVTFNENITGGGAYGDITLKAGDALVTISKVIDGKVLTITPVSTDYSTAYTLTIPAGAAVDAAGNAQKKGYIMSFTTGAKPEEDGNEGGPSGGGSGGDVLQPEKIDVTGSIDDRAHSFVSAGEAEEGSGIVPILVNDALLNEGLEAGGSGPRVTISVEDAVSLLFTGITGQTVKNMAERGAVLEITTGLAGYTIPAELLNIDEIAGQFGGHVNLGDIAIDIRVAEPSPDLVRIMEDAAGQGSLSILVPPVEFAIECTYNGRTIAVEHFRVPVERRIPIPAGVDPNRITTAVVVERDGTLRHIPTKVVEIEGVYYAQIMSLTNSVYTLIWNPVEFRDMEGHWAKEYVNDSGSRLIVSGVENGIYKPDSMITRAELAAIITRALGIKSKAGGNGFTDVTEGDWFYGAVNAAMEYGIIAGYGDGSFKPDRKVTREESFSMIAKAMELACAETGAVMRLTEAEATYILTGFADSAELGSWSRKAVAYAVRSGIVS